MATRNTDNSSVYINAALTALWDFVKSKAATQEDRDLWFAATSAAAGNYTPELRGLLMNYTGWNNSPVRLALEWAAGYAESGEMTLDEFRQVAYQALYSAANYSPEDLYPLRRAHWAACLCRQRQLARNAR